MSTKQLAERRANLWSQMQGIMADAERDSRDLTAEERETWDRLEADLSALTSDMDRFQRSADLQRSLEAPIETDLDAAGKGTRQDDAELTERAFAEYLRRGIDGIDPELRAIIESRAQSVGTNSAGGYMVPQGFLEKITETMKAYGGILNAANVINTETGNPLPWPTNDDTGNSGALLSENSQISAQDASFGQVMVNAYTYTSKLILVSEQLLQDSAFDLDTWLPKKIGQRLGRAVAADLATGNGSSKPTGIGYAPTTGKTGTTGQTTSIIYDDLVDLEHSVDVAYRNAGNCAFAMADSSLAVIRKLKDSYGHPLWQPDMAATNRDTILGYPVIVDNGLPAMAASAKSVLFGDFEAGFLVRVAADVTVKRLTERYADYLQVGFFGFQRIDAKPDDGAAIRAYVNSAS